jgi:hypothetical protein
MAWRRSQSHGEQMPGKKGIYGDYGDMPELPVQARYSRRALLRAAVFDTCGQEAGLTSASTVVTGVVTDVSRHSIAVQGDAGERVLSLAPSTVAWLGARVTPSALRPGDQVIVRHQPWRAGAGRQAPAVAVRIWARIGRVTGTIVAVEGREEREFLVDAGRQGRPAERVVVAGASLRQIQVRFPRLAPGYLIDVIGTRHPGYLLAVAPATAQPPYRAGHPPAPPRVSGRLADPLSGTAVWHEPDDEPAGLLGLAYPALDPDTDNLSADPARVTRSPAPGQDQGCVRLPYLSLGSTVRVRNECTHRAAVLPVTSCGVTARQFCDRCVACGTPPRGRVADLTMAAFVELGGNLEDNCFNATLALAYLS